MVSSVSPVVVITKIIIASSSSIIIYMYDIPLAPYFFFPSPCFVFTSFFFLVLLLISSAINLVTTRLPAFALSAPSFFYFSLFFPPFQSVSPLYDPTSVTHSNSFTSRTVDDQHQLIFVDRLNFVRRLCSQQHTTYTLKHSPQLCFNSALFIFLRLVCVFYDFYALFRLNPPVFSFVPSFHTHMVQALHSFSYPLGLLTRLQP